MTSRPLHIAFLTPVPKEDGGISGVATDILDGLCARGHRVDCFLPNSGRDFTTPERLRRYEHLTFTWSDPKWNWNQWYSRTRLTSFVSGMLARATSYLRLRRTILAMHDRDPYDLIYQFSSPESLAAPVSLTRRIPLVIHPETHAAGEVRSMVAERELALKTQSPVRFGVIVTVTGFRWIAQMVGIGRAKLLICLSEVFRGHLVRDNRFRGATVVIPNPVRIERFPVRDTQPHDPPVVLVLGRISVRKGIEDVIALAHELERRECRARIRIVGAPTLWSDYTPLLADLPESNSEYAGSVPDAGVPAELDACDVMLQASHYEPFALTVSEGLASGVPVVATTEVGASEGVDPEVMATVRPGDVPALADAVEATLARIARDPHQIATLARSEAERLFAPSVVCAAIDRALGELVDGPQS